MKKIRVRRILAWIMVITMLMSNNAFAGVWSYLDNIWSYQVNGENQTGWVEDNGNWYHFDTTGAMQTGWYKENANDLYYLNTAADGVEGMMRTGWFCKDNVWYFFNTVHDGFYGKAYTDGWYWIDGCCYLFDAEGRMYADCTTPDGYTVNADGQWINEGEVQYVPEKGIITKTEAVEEKKEEAAKSEVVEDYMEDDYSEPEEKPAKKPEKIDLAKSVLELEVGMYERLELESSLDGVTWTSSDPDVAEVSALGTVTAMGVGTATITADNGTYSDSCQVIVTEEELALNAEELVLNLYEEETLTLIGTDQTPKWVSSDSAIVNVDEQGNIEALGVGTATVRADVENRSVSCIVKVLAVDLSENPSSTVSRGQWIEELLEATGYDLSTLDDDALIYYFSDTEESEYGKAIEYAYASGIILDDTDVQDVPVFDPEAPTTREFAAVTGVRALLFTAEGDELECADSDELEYGAEDAVAVRQSLLFLDADNKFRPNDNLTVPEKEQFLAAALGIKNSEAVLQNINPGEILKEEVEYSPDTLSQEDLAGVTYKVLESNADGTELKIQIFGGEELGIQAGHNLLLPENEEFPSGLPVYVEDAEEKNDGSIVITGYIQTDITKVISSLKFLGSATFDPENAEGLNGVTMSYDPEGSIDAAGAAAYGGRFSKSIPGKLKFDFGEGVKINDHVKLEGSVEFEIPNLTVESDIDVGFFKLKVNQMTFSITEKMKVDGGLKATVIESEYFPGYPGSKEIGRLPFKLGTTGFSLDLVASIYYSAEGEFKVIYTIQATEGFQYKNKDFRFIGNVQQDVQLPTVEGKAELGMKMALNLVFMKIWDIVGVDNKIGPAVTVSAKNHVNNALICFDATLYLSSKIELNDETIIGDFLKEKLHYTLEHQYWDENESPLKLKFHVENGTRVDECTAARGDVKGRVMTNDNQPLGNARVILKSGNMEVSREYTNANGYYTFNNVVKGTYTLIVSKDGYTTFSNEIQVETGSFNQQGDIIMVLRNAAGQGIVSGTVKDATNLESIEGSYIVYKDWGVTSGNEVVRGNFDGSYSITLEAGNYTIVFVAEDYSKTSVNVAVNANGTHTHDVELSPCFVLGASNMRVVLRWGEHPWDLDSHMFGPAGNGAIFHTYYAQKNQGGTWLDVDDVTSYGPETTTVETMHDGIYSFYVHDFTNLSSTNSVAMSNSGAYIQVYIGNAHYTTIHIPQNVGGTVWHVFDYNSETDEFTLVNTMRYSGDPSSLGRNVMLCDLDVIGVTEDEACMAIHQAALDSEKEDDVNQVEGEAEQPEGEVEQPEDEAEQPEGEAEQPEDEAEQPEGEAEQPEGEAEQPEDEAEQPEGEAEQPNDDAEDLIAA